MKKLLIGIMFIILLVAGLGTYFIMNSGSLLKEAVNKYAPKMTQTTVTLEEVKISLTSGAALMKGLNIGNPKGFSNKHSMKIEAVNIKISLGELFNDLMYIDEITIRNIDLNLEIGKSGNNFKIIQENIISYLKSKGIDMDNESESEIKFIVKKINIIGTKVQAQSDMVKSKISLILPSMTLSNIGTAKNGATGGEIAQEIFAVINKSLAKNVTANLLKDKAKNALNNVKKDLLKKAKGLFK